MNSDLSRQFNNLNAIEIVDELKDRIIAQVRIARFECLNEFLSTKMEKNTCLEQHMRKMHEIDYTMVSVWNYEMTDDLAIDGVLRSLPLASRIISVTMSWEGIRSLSVSLCLDCVMSK